MGERIAALRAAASALTQMRLDLDASGDLYSALYQAERAIWDEMRKLLAIDAEPNSEEKHESTDDR